MEIAPSHWEEMGKRNGDILDQLFFLWHFAEQRLANCSGQQLLVLLSYPKNQLPAYLAFARFQGKNIGINLLNYVE